MACSLQLNTRISNETTGGYFVLLGYSPVSLVAANSNNNDAFGILDPLDNGFNGETANDNIVSNNPYSATVPGTFTFSLFTPYNYTISLNFANTAVGYYGVMYIVGDTGQTGNIPLALQNCGDVELFEIEVVNKVPAQPVHIDFTYCVSDVPATIDLNDSGILTNPGNVVAFSTASANPWSFNANTGIITTGPNPTPVGIYGFFANISSQSETHDIISGCCASASVLIRFTIVADVSAGTPSPITVCN